MDWIKRNLFFVVGAVVALVFIGLASYYTLSGLKQNAEEREKLNATYDEMKQLKEKTPHPGDRKVDNVKLAKDQQAELQAFIAKINQHFEPIPAIPPGTNVSSEAYATALRLTIDQLQREATNNSVILPDRYNFSFAAQRQLVKFTPGSLEPLAVQLGEVRAICAVLNSAKVNALDGIRRERVSADDNAGSPADYLELRSTTNELAVITPYEVTFRCFTPELALVLAGIASSPHGLIVKGINVEPSASLAISPDAAMVAAPAYVPYVPPPIQPRAVDEGGASDAFARRYGRGVPGALGPGPYPTPYQAPQPAMPVATAPAKPGLKTLLGERQIKVTMLIHVVKILPRK